MGRRPRQQPSIDIVYRDAKGKRLAKEHGIAAPAPSPVAKERRDSDREYHEKKLNDRRAVKEGRLEKLFESSGDDY
jgi:hypothetical protein